MLLWWAALAKLGSALGGAAKAAGGALAGAAKGAAGGAAPAMQALPVMGTGPAQSGVMSQIGQGLGQGATSSAMPYVDLLKQARNKDWRGMGESIASMQGGGDQQQQPMMPAPMPGGADPRGGGPGMDPRMVAAMAEKQRGAAAAPVPSFQIGTPPEGYIVPGDPNDPDEEKTIKVHPGERVDVQPVGAGPPPAMNPAEFARRGAASATPETPGMPWWNVRQMPEDVTSISGGRQALNAALGAMQGAGGFGKISGMNEQDRQRQMRKFYQGELSRFQGLDHISPEQSRDLRSLYNQAYGGAPAAPGQYAERMTTRMVDGVAMEQRQSHDPRLGRREDPESWVNQGAPTRPSDPSGSGRQSLRPTNAQKARHETLREAQDRLMEMDLPTWSDMQQKITANVTGPPTQQQKEYMDALNPTAYEMAEGNEEEHAEMDERRAYIRQRFANLQQGENDRLAAEERAELQAEEDRKANTFWNRDWFGTSPEQSTGGEQAATAAQQAGDREAQEVNMLERIRRGEPLP